MHVGCQTYRRLRQMTQRAQEQRIHNDLPSQLRKHLDHEKSCDIPEVASWEESDVRRIPRGEECEGAGRQEQRALRNRHRDYNTQQRREKDKRRESRSEEDMQPLNIVDATTRPHARSFKLLMRKRLAAATHWPVRRSVQRRDWSFRIPSPYFAHNTT